MSIEVLNLPEREAATEAERAPGYHIMTWGCQMNEEDSEQMSLYLEGMGYRAVGTAAEADVVLLNTCSVRAKPEEKVWSELGHLKELKRDRPDMVIGVCGCMAQVESAAIKRRAPFVDMVVGTGNIAALPNLIRQAKGEDTEEAAADRQAQREYNNLIPLTLMPAKTPSRGKTLTALELRVSSSASRN
jgi:tRNA-2-methylthio-N6-dimethylallyladenosine synthase